MDTEVALTADEVIHLRDTLSKGVVNMRDPIWQKAFTVYNYKVLFNEKRPKTMNCNGCYRTVYLHFLNESLQG